MALPDISTLTARFGRELTSNGSLTWHNTNLSTALAEAVPAIYVIVQADGVTYPNASKDQTACLRIYLLKRYGYI